MAFLLKQPVLVKKPFLFLRDCYFQNVEKSPVINDYIGNKESNNLERMNLASILHTSYL